MARKVRIALNGFGRIGRHVFRSLFIADWCQVVGVRVLSELKLRDRLHDLKHDPYYGSDESVLSISVNERVAEFVSDSTRIPFFQVGDSKWEKCSADIIIDCSGVKSFSEIESMAQYASRVVVTHPVKEARMIIFGVNHESYDSSARIISAGSCTTNCAVPILYPFIYEKNFTLLECSGVTVHSATRSQETLKALEQIVDYTTGASTAVEEIFPHLRGKTMFSSFRVPTAQVSCLELNCRFDPVPDPIDIRCTLLRASKSYLAGVLDLVSAPKKKDFSGLYKKEPYSAIVNTESVERAPNGSLIKIHAWYDNEYAYSLRVVDLVEYIARIEQFVVDDSAEEFIDEYIPGVENE
ncbi:MAG: glyceraldehyde 3-phosphate dehydrogenase NAD-binding domain-containing protein [Patescibacteria group bacterium]